MKKIKIYSTFIKNMKRNFILVALPVFVGATCFGCVKVEKKEKEENNYLQSSRMDTTENYKDDLLYTKTTTENYQDVLDYENNTYSTEYAQENNSVGNDFFSKSVSFKTIDISDLEKVIRSKRAYYQYEDLYNTKDTLEKYYAMVEYESTNKFEIIDEKSCEINRSKLKEIVIENNKEFLENNNMSMYSELTEENFNYIFDTMCYILDYRLKDDIDKAQLEEKLNNLKIVKYNNSGYGALSDDNTVLSINTDNILKNGNTIFLEMVTAHETNHLVQINSKTEENKENGYKKNLGALYDFGDENYDALNYQWIEEAAAEELMKYNLNEIDPNKIQYTNQVSALESISFSTIPKEDVDAITLSKLLCQSDLDKIFDLFNCETEEDKIEVINMFYTFETIYNQSFCKKNNITNDNTYKFDNQNAMITTLTKNFYLNLTYALKNDEESLQNIFYLIDTFETEMNKVSGGYIKNEDYYNIKDEFMATLEYLIGVDDVTAIYSSFKGTGIVGESYCLSEDDIGFLTYVENDSSRSSFKLK